MADKTRLLYLLSDVAYVADLMPGKKPNSFVITSFRQINGEFIKKDAIQQENVGKLFSKLEKDGYVLVLPDQIFTYAISEVPEKAESKIRDYVASNTLTELGLDTDHVVDVSILTQHQDTAKVQITAVDEQFVDKLAGIAKEHEVQIDTCVPLSWTLKSLISLEPSISIVQMGEHLHLAFHYIGVENCSQYDLTQANDIKTAVEKIKSAEASTQTVYLVTNTLIENDIKEALQAFIPVQQASAPISEEGELPLHLKSALEAGAKTLSIAEYMVPHFKIMRSKGKSKVKSEEKAEIATLAVELKTTEPELDKPELEKPESTLPVVMPAPAAPDEPLPLPESKSLSMEPETTTMPNPTPEDKEDLEMTADETDGKTKDADKAEKVVEDNKADKKEDKSSDLDESVSFSSPLDAVATTSDKDTVGEKTEEKPDLSLFAPGGSSKTVDIEQQPDKKIVAAPNSGAPMLKMVFVTLIVLFITVGVGVGLGLGVLSLSNKAEVDTNPVVEASPRPSPVAATSPSPSPVSELDKSKIKLMVVNATTVAGKAGKSKTLLEEADFVGVKTGNAKGKYEEGDTYVLLKEENPALLAELEKALGIKLTIEEGIKTEDAKGEFDAVIVLANPE